MKIKHELIKNVKHWHQLHPKYTWQGLKQQHPAPPVPPVWLLPVPH